MSEGEALYPFEFSIQATPMSLQASSKSRAHWKNEIQEAARRRVRDTVDFTFLDNRPLALTIYYFTSAPMIGDVDNIVKPIMDALKGVAYLNDRVVERVVVQKFEPDVDWRIAEPSEQLAKVLRAATSNMPSSAVYLRVDDDLSWRRL